MIYTAEQFKQITDGDNYIYMDDLPFDKQGLDFFNALPEHLQGEAVQWGTGDTVFRENLFEYMINNQFGMTIKQYYGSTISKYKYGEYIPINFSYLPGYKLHKEPEPEKEIFDEEIDNLNSVMIFHKNYDGYESFFDFDSDMREVFGFDANNNIPEEFTGSIKVTIEYYPSKEDKQTIKNNKNGNN